MSLLEWNRRGIIPGPGESDAEYFARGRRWLRHRGRGATEEALALTRDLFDVAPDWAPVRYTNKGLAPWHGGCLLFDDKRVSIRLRRSLKTRSRLLGIYRREELLAHELLHIGRAAFPDTPYEELIAHQTTPGRLRRILAPIFQSNREALLFLSTMALPLITPYFYLAPAALAGLGLTRLGRHQRIWRRCLERLESLTGSALSARAITYRLTAEEMARVASEGTGWLEEPSGLRWRIIREAYLDL